MRKILAPIVLAVGITATLSTSASAMPLYGNDKPILSLDFRTPAVSPTIVQDEKKPIKKETPKEETQVKEVSKPAPLKVYKVVEGDNLSLIAEKYHTTWQRIWSKNKFLKNQDMLRVGQKLVIPNKDEKLKKRKPVVQTVPTTTLGPKTPYRGSQSVTEHVSGQPNAYTYGWCTWWVKEKRPDIGGYWGNAGYNWISSAQAAGFSTGSIPRAGAIGVQAGHVVYVESVNGSTVNISEMGWGYHANSTPHYRSVSASSFTYIY